MTSWERRSQAFERYAATLHALEEAVRTMDGPAGVSAIVRASHALEDVVTACGRVKVASCP